MFFNLLGTWIRGLLSIAVLVGGVLLIKEWVEELPKQERVKSPSTGAEVVRPLSGFSERLHAWDPGLDRATGLLVAGVLILGFACLGRLASPWLWRPAGRGGEREAHDGGAPEVHRLETRNGYTLHVEIHGHANSPPLVLVHGVGSDRTQWNEAVDDLSGLFRIYTFDLLGHGKSDRVSQAEHTLEAAADDLNDVIALTGTDKVVLAGHSMGGMIAMTWCRAYPKRVPGLAGLVLIHTTPQNPFETMAPVGLHRALQKPVHEPVLRMTPALAPIVRIMNALDYLNGMTHWTNDRVMFGGSESREQLERTARLHARMDPAAVARFTLSMASFDARPILPKLDVPTLVIAADKDGVTIPEAGRVIARGIPRATFLALQDARHMGFMERRVPFADAIAAIGDRSDVDRKAV